MLRAARAVVTLTLARASSRRPYDLRNTIVVSGSPRSGTTWLAEMIATLPRSAICFEPLHLDQVPAARRAGFGWRTILDEMSDEPELASFMRNVLEGRVLDRWTTQDMRPSLPPKTWIVKFVRTNRLLPWLVSNFDVRRPVVILRHPCDVVASQLARDFPSDPPPDETVFLRAHPEFSDVHASLATPEERLAFVWASDTFLPLTSALRDRYDVICYEDLVRDSVAIVERLFAGWSLPAPNGLRARSTRRSFTSSADRYPGLTKEEANRVLRVTHAFGLDFYDTSPQPHGDHPLLSSSAAPR